MARACAVTTRTRTTKPSRRVSPPPLLPPRQKSLPRAAGAPISTSRWTASATTRSFRPPAPSSPAAATISVRRTRCCGAAPPLRPSPSATSLRRPPPRRSPLPRKSPSATSRKKPGCSRRWRAPPRRSATPLSRSWPRGRRSTATRPSPCWSRTAAATTPRWAPSCGTTPSAWRTPCAPSAWTPAPARSSMAPPSPATSSPWTRASSSVRSRTSRTISPWRWVPAASASPRCPTRYPPWASRSPTAPSPPCGSATSLNPASSSTIPPRWPLPWAGISAAATSWATSPVCPMYSSPAPPAPVNPSAPTPSSSACSTSPRRTRSVLSWWTPRWWSWRPTTVSRTCSSPWSPTPKRPPAPCNGRCSR